jgi:hypothetical protein
MAYYQPLLNADHPHLSKQSRPGVEAISSSGRSLLYVVLESILARHKAGWESKVVHAYPENYDLACVR